MVKLIIVDDEEITRDSLLNLINWNELGITISGSAANGIEALDVYAKNGADIVLTDIRMPKMNGIELMKKLKKIDPSIIIIVLSAYDDFSYAQESLKSGAFDYILKPIEIEKLIDVVKRAVKAKNQEFMRKKREQMIQKQLKESLPLLREKFLSQLLTRPMPNLREKIKYLNLDIQENFYFVILLEIDDYAKIIENYSEQDIQLTDFMVINIVDETLENHKHAILSSGEGSFSIIMTAKSKDHIKSTILEHCERIRSNLNKFASLNITQSVGRIVSDLNDIHYSHKDALLAMEYKFYLGKNQIIFYDEVEPFEMEKIYYPIKLEEQLVMSIKKADIDSALRVLDEIWQSFTEKNLAVDIIKRWCIELIALITRSLVELGENPDIFFKNTDPWSIIKKLETIDDTRAWIQNIIEAVTEYIALKRKSKNKKIVEKALEIIEKEYANKNLTLNDIATKLYITPNYLSYLFKSETGENFTEYLTKIRIDKAKELLKNLEFKIYEIADAVGYADPHHFSRVFKRQEGITPAEYRDQII
ncbi:two-component system, response regulator YesN [Caldanaerobius fijiensis DSM 17918]|uniref:Stage 0 sporulation protein A homolog n=1 Tax=Caldanaerobius fijiensis DSM 17918 TaxID=1121256 RepID=A0A1M4XAQ8_9THEO|nr:response regulator [Caldanaerobius fijiensis]SHE90262.1 two-component system, response regulator YesN [Caldanaerobius fijiensis DSM 17918]